MKNELELKQQRTEEFEEIYFSEIGMCGCGRPDLVKEFIFKLLKNLKDYQCDTITYESMVENRKTIITETDSDTIFEFVFHIFEHNDLIEHGGSVYGSWFTDKGERFVELLSENLLDT